MGSRLRSLHLLIVFFLPIPFLPASFLAQHGAISTTFEKVFGAPKIGGAPNFVWPAGALVMNDESIGGNPFVQVDVVSGSVCN